MKCPLCERTVAETDVACPGCDEMLSEWWVLNGNSRLLRQRGLHLASRKDLVGACLSFMQAALGDPTDIVSLVDAGRSLILLGRNDDAARILQHAHSRSRESGARDLIDLLKQLSTECEESCEESHDDESASDVKEPSITPERSKPTAETSAKGAPLLAIELLTQQKMFMSKDADTLWLSILHTEQHWQDDWKHLRGWLSAACGVEQPHPALLYLRGLDAWQSDDPHDALTHFSRCLLQEPTVLNPIAWSIYATIVTDGKIEGILGMATDQVGAKSVKTAADALKTRLQEIDTDHSRDAVRRLRKAGV